MSNCCNDPTEPQKVDPRELLREQERFGNLLRDLYTGNPEEVLLKQLQSASRYIRELAAMRAFHDAVRLHAIGLLDGESESILERIVQNEPNSIFAESAQKKLLELKQPKKNPLKKLMQGLTG
ncbi:MAG: hypothetical protein ACU833_08645 [Gammaproteobacteria bacterium]